MYARDGYATAAREIGKSRKRHRAKEQFAVEIASRSKREHVSGTSLRENSLVDDKFEIERGRQAGWVRTNTQNVFPRRKRDVYFYSCAVPAAEDVSADFRVGLFRVAVSTARLSGRANPEARANNTTTVRVYFAFFSDNYIEQRATPRCH